MAALIPRRLAVQAEEAGRLRVIEQPYDSPLVEVQLLYRRDRLSDPATAWMRDRLSEVGRGV
jgi:DNA-binding transcriptional LysR family regulator